MTPSQYQYTQESRFSYSIPIRMNIHIPLRDIRILQFQESEEEPRPGVLYVIPPPYFAREMSKFWEESLGNVPNLALMATWEQMAEAFFKHINAGGNTNREKNWTVLCPPTGTGKTQGTILYCSILSQLLLVPQMDHPGVLIVTRLISEADTIAKEINQTSERYAPGISGNGPVAISYHSETKRNHTTQELRRYPVLVITHRAFQLALDNLDTNSSGHSRWDNLHAFGERQRKLIIIDEAIDLIEESQLDGDELRMLLGLIPQKLRDEFPSEILLLEKLQSYFDYVAWHFARRKSDKPHRDRISSGCALLDSKIPTLAKDNLPPPDFMSLSDAIRKIRSEDTGWTALTEDSKDERRVRRGLDDLIRAADSIWRKSWRMDMISNGKFTLNTARLLVPEGVKGAVVLDATAGENVFYEVFQRAERTLPIPGTRRYDNVTLHFSRGHATGKIFMRKSAKELSSQLVSNLDGVTKDRNVLIITHMDVEKKLQKETNKLSGENGCTVATTHWGAFGGLNEWKDYDTVVIFGLFYRPDSWPINTFIACQGAQTNRWLSATGDRPFGDHQDIKEALIVGQLVTDVIQGINRIRCRKVIDEEGNCPPADIYILLPRGDRGEAILEGIRNAMPGINLVDWEYSGQKRQPKKSRHEDTLMEFLRNATEDRILAAQIRETLKIPATSFNRLIGRIRENDLEDPLVASLAETGISYEVSQEGDVKRAYFIREKSGDSPDPHFSH